MIMKNWPHTIITAAGRSEEVFLGAGFDAPKNLLIQGGTQILCRAVSSYALDLSKTTVALNKEECLYWPTAKILKACHPTVSLALVSSKVPGALASSVIAVAEVPSQSSLVIAAGDSEIKEGIAGYVQQFQDSELDAGTVVFQSKNPRWSYISVDQQGRVRQVAEKRVIGPLATSGVFYFRTVEIFQRAAEWCFINNAKSRGQYYVSTALNALIMKGLTVGYIEIPRSKYISWSLPIDFIAQSE